MLFAAAQCVQQSRFLQGRDDRRPFFADGRHNFLRADWKLDRGIYLFARDRGFSADIATYESERRGRVGSGCILCASRRGGILPLLPALHSRPSSDPAADVLELIRGNLELWNAGTEIAEDAVRCSLAHETDSCFFQSS